ncbi:hypothetical protein BD769DRAFT_1470490 [Suillus cothurnatus]|nr:hypothetical protein BD769DRAFT_1470490 [Suillus cothurnatus]
MRFSFLAVIVALAASIMSIKASDSPIFPEDGVTLSYDTLAKYCDQNIGSISDREYCYDTIKRAGRFARRDALIGLYKLSEGEELEEDLRSHSSDGVGHRRQPESGEVGEKLPPRSSDGGTSGQEEMKE